MLPMPIFFSPGQALLSLLRTHLDNMTLGKYKEAMRFISILFFTSIKDTACTFILHYMHAFLWVIWLAISAGFFQESEVGRLIIRSF